VTHFGRVQELAASMADITPFKVSDPRIPVSDNANYNRFMFLIAY
jgi:hypothetical protein